MKIKYMHVFKNKKYFDRRDIKLDKYKFEEVGTF